MASSGPPSSNLPPSMGPGARPLQPGERPGGLLQEITEIRSHYQVHLASNAIELAYELKGQQRHYRLPFDKIPIGGWTQALCYGGPSSSAVTGTLLIDMIRATENISGRQITQEEAEGMAFYGSRRMVTMYIGQITAIGMGLGSAWIGRKDMKFPFMKPKSPERYESFPMRVIPILKGQYARAMWQITRTNVYIIMWLFLTNPLFRSVADTRMTVGLYADRRTHDLTQIMKGNFDRLRSNRANEAATRMQNQQQVPRQSSQDTQNPDDASPAAFYDNQPSDGQGSFVADSSFTDGNTDTGLISDKAIEQRQTKQASPNSWSRAQSRGSRSEMQQQPKSTSSSSSSSDFFFDDASPTAGNDPDMSTPQPYTRQSSGSAWARLRKGENVQSSGRQERQPSGRVSSPDQPSDFETKPDSFSYSGSEEERRLAKQQAQKDFDAMLDKERREGGSGDYERDMRATGAGEEPGQTKASGWSKWRRD